MSEVNEVRDAVAVQAYRVELEAEGCRECGHMRLWRVVGPDDVATSTLYEDKDEAEHLAAALSGAYDLGRQSLNFLRDDLAKAQAWNVYFRDAFGECHLMISRNTAEYQVRHEWEPTDLPHRLQRLMRTNERMRDLLREDYPNIDMHPEGDNADF